MDKEKVIKTLIDALTSKENYPWARAEMSFDFIKMLLDLLKEQEEAINDLTETIRQLNQHIKDLSEYMTPYGKVKDVKAYAELLKEQEPIPAIDVTECGWRVDDCRYGKCPKCGKGIMSYHDYCGYCGQAVKWDD